MENTSESTFELSDLQKLVLRALIAITIIVAALTVVFDLNAYSFTGYAGSLTHVNENLDVVPLHWSSEYIDSDFEVLRAGSLIIQDDETWSFFGYVPNKGEVVTSTVVSFGFRFATVPFHYWQYARLASDEEVAELSSKVFLHPLRIAFDDAWDKDANQIPDYGPNYFFVGQHVKPSNSFRFDDGQKEVQMEGAMVVDISRDFVRVVFSDGRIETYNKIHFIPAEEGQVASEPWYSEDWKVGNTFRLHDYVCIADPTNDNNGSIPYFGVVTDVDEEGLLEVNYQGRYSWEWFKRCE